MSLASPAVQQADAIVQRARSSRLVSKGAINTQASVEGGRREDEEEEEEEGKKKVETADGERYAKIGGKDVDFKGREKRRKEGCLTGLLLALLSLRVGGMAMRWLPIAS